jgi:hypothetical protein
MRNRFMKSSLVRFVGWQFSPAVIENKSNPLRRFSLGGIVLGRAEPYSREVRMRSITSLAIWTFCTAGAFAQGLSPLWPDVRYTPEIPTQESVLGFGPAERLASPDEILRYVETLQQAAPSRVTIFDIGDTWEGRKLIYFAIGSAETMARLSEIESGMQALSDPRVTPSTTADRLVESLPVPVWLGYSIHGNELSGADAALATAYHLLAAEGDPLVDSVMENTVVFINPLQNPDGRARFLHDYERVAGPEPLDSPLAAEHDQPWPSGRMNHYLFDLNRDFLALTQPEVKAQVRELQRWYPQVYVDLHTMGSNSTYYFAPAADPYNPYLTQTQKERQHVFGRNNAKWFDTFGFDYFTREVYDSFYPGYGESWPMYYGAIGMTYEQASVRGMRIRRSDGTTLEYPDAVRRHFVASVSTLEAAAANRTTLLRDFYEYRRTAIQEGQRAAYKAYLIPPGPDPSTSTKLARLLVEHGIEVRRARERIRIGTEEYSAGTYVVDLDQPAYRLIRTLLDPSVDMDPGFIEEQERRRANKRPDEIYDVTAWSLPLLFNARCIGIATRVSGELDAVAGSSPNASPVVRRAEVAYLVPWGAVSSARFLAGALRAGLSVWSANEGFSHGGRSYPAGSLIVKLNDNPESLLDTVLELALESGAEVIGVDSSWVDAGPNFGSDKVIKMDVPRVALGWDWPTSAYSAGATRFVLDRELGYPVTPVRMRTLARNDLSMFDVIVLPSGDGYKEHFGEAGVERLRRWVDAGGVLIGSGEAVAFLADPDVDLLSIRAEDKIEADTSGETEAKPSTEPSDSGRLPGSELTTETAYSLTIAAEEERPDAVAGVLARALVDTEHWMGAGIAEEVYAVVQGRNIYRPITLDKGYNVARFAGPDEVLASGYLWEENRRQLAFKPFAVAEGKGRGYVIGFTADPTFRAYMDGLNLLFFNAIFRGAAMAEPAY